MRKYGWLRWVGIAVVAAVVVGSVIVNNLQHESQRLDLKRGKEVHDISNATTTPTPQQVTDDLQARKETDYCLAA